MFTAEPRPDSTTDVDERDRQAFNAAFHALDLPWYWDVDTYRGLLSLSTEEQRVRSYLGTEHPHLLKAYDAQFLIDAILAASARHSKRGDIAARAKRL